MTNRYRVTSQELVSRGLFDKAVKDLLTNYVAAIRNHDLYLASAFYEQAYNIQFRARQDIPEYERGERLTRIESTVFETETLPSERELIHEAMRRDQELMEYKSDAPSYRTLLRSRLEHSSLKEETED
jgi:hypothetical protein